MKSGAGAELLQSPAPTHHGLPAAGTHPCRVLATGWATLAGRCAPESTAYAAATLGAVRFLGLDEHLGTCIRCHMCHIFCHTQ